MIACVALGTTIASAEPSEQNSQGDAQVSNEAAVPRIHEATSKLDRAVTEQFVRGQVDRDALGEHIAAVLDATPEEHRPAAKRHIEQVITHAETLASQMPADERAKAVESSAHDGEGHLDVWGLGYGYPGAYGYGLGYGVGYGAYGCGYGAYGCGYGACGAGLYW
jgi:hypothetical protein